MHGTKQAISLKLLIALLTLGIIFTALAQLQAPVYAQGEDCKDEKGNPVFCTPTPTDTPKPTSGKPPTATNTKFVPPSDTPKPTSTVFVSATFTAVADTVSPTSTFKPTVLGVSATPLPPSPTPVPPSPTRPRTPTQVPMIPLPLGDIWVTGIEVTQSIQIYGAGSLDNSIPLLAYKKTVVRVYVRSDSFSPPWRNVTARLTVTGPGLRGRVLEPSTSSPSLAITVSPDGSHRSRMDDSFNFVLDSDQTRSGDVDLSVRIYDFTGRPESNIANNVQSLRILFKPGLYKTIYAFPHGTCDSANNATPPPWSMIEPQRRYVENTYPLTQFWVVRLPGSDPAPCFRTDSMARSDQRANGWAVAQINRVCPSGGCQSFTFNPIIPERGGQAGWCCNSGVGGNSVFNGDTRNDAQSPGSILAQEYGHNFLGNPHTFDAVMGYPWSDNTIGRQIGMRTSVGTYGWGLETRLNTNGDIMSYNGSPLWISPFTYCNLMSSISTRNLACPAGSLRALDAGPSMASLKTKTLNAPPSANENQYLQITGWLTADERAAFEPFEIFTTTNLLPAVPENQIGNTYHLVVYDKLDNPITDFYFQRPTGTHEQPGDSAWFNLMVPYDPAIVAVKLFKGDALLASRASSAHKPEIKVPSPGAGQTLSGMQTLTWQASDPDGDPLTFALDYSIDDGGTWIPLGSSIEKNSLQVNFDSVPGSDQARLKVSVTDGFNTNAAESATFKVPKRGAEITLSGVPDDFSTYHGQPFYVEARAFDWEDGPLTDQAAYVWTSDQDGPIGAGLWITPQSLSVGKHTLTVTVQDSDGNVSSASVRVTILESQPEKVSEARGPEGYYLLLAVLAGIGLLSIVLLIVGVRYMRSRRPR